LFQERPVAIESPPRSVHAPFPIPPGTLFLRLNWVSQPDYLILHHRCAPFSRTSWWPAGPGWSTVFFPPFTRTKTPLIPAGTPSSVEQWGTRSRPSLYVGMPTLLPISVLSLTPQALILRVHDSSIFPPVDGSDLSTGPRLFFETDPEKFFFRLWPFVERHPPRPVPPTLLDIRQ